MINIKEHRLSKGIKCSEMAKAMDISVKRYKWLEDKNNTDILRFMKPTESELKMLDIGVLWYYLMNRRIKISSTDLGARKRVISKYSEAWNNPSTDEQCNSVIEEVNNE